MSRRWTCYQQWKELSSRSFIDSQSVKSSKYRVTCGWRRHSCGCKHETRRSTSVSGGDHAPKWEIAPLFDGDNDKSQHFMFKMSAAVTLPRHQCVDAHQQQVQQQRDSARWPLALYALSQFVDLENLATADWLAAEVYTPWAIIDRVHVWRV